MDNDNNGYCVELIESSSLFRVLFKALAQDRYEFQRVQTSAGMLPTEFRNICDTLDILAKQLQHFNDVSTFCCVPQKYLSIH